MELQVSDICLASCHLGMMQDPALGWGEELVGTGFQPCAMAVGEEFVPFESLLRPNVAIRLENCFIRLVTCCQKWM